MLTTFRFEMPEIPDDWRPRPARVWGTTRQWDEMPGAKKEEKEVIRGAPGRPLTFEQVRIDQQLPTEMVLTV
jgi:G patch domain-containing protein 1